MDQIPRDRRKKFLVTLVPGIKGTKESSWVEEPITLPSPPQPSYIQRGWKRGRKGVRKGERERKEGKGEREMEGAREKGGEQEGEKEKDPV